MKWLSSFNSGDGEKQTLALHIGSARIEALLFSEKQGKPHITYATSEVIAVLPKEDPEQFEKEMAASLLVLLLRVQSEALTETQSKELEVRCFLSSPWHNPRVERATKEKQRPFKVTKRTIEEMVESSCEEIAATHKSITKGEKLVECAATGIRVNGYPSGILEPVQAKSVLVDIYSSFVSNKSYDRIEEVLTKVFHGSIIDIGTLPRALYHTLQRIAPKETDYLLFDITGETTEVLVASKGSLLNVRHFPIGKNHLVRAVATDLKIHTTDARSQLDSYLRGDMMSKHGAKLAKAVERASGEWAREVAKTLKQLSNRVVLPEKAYIAAEKVATKHYINVLLKGNTLENKIKAVAYDTSLLSSYIRTSSDVHLVDPFAATCALFCLEEENTVE